MPGREASSSPSAGCCTNDVDDAKGTATAFIESGARTATIPESVRINGKDYTVTAVAVASSSARGTLRSVTLPKTVSAVGNGAFANCAKLKSVALGSATTTIGAKAFKGCANLAKVSIPSSVTAIEPSVFSGCSALKSVTVPAKVKSIGKYAFYKSGVRTLTVKSTKLTKKGIEGCLKGSNVATVEVPKSKLKAYKRIYRQR